MLANTLDEEREKGCHFRLPRRNDLVEIAAWTFHREFLGAFKKLSVVDRAVTSVANTYLRTIEDIYELLVFTQ